MLDLEDFELSPEKLARGCYWRLQRGPSGSIIGKPIPEPDPEAPWMLILPRGLVFDAAVREEETPHREKIRDGKATDAERLAMVCRAHGRATVKGWGNIAMGGQVVPFSEAMAIDLMTQDRWQALQEFVFRAFADLSAAAKKEVDKAEGN